MIDIEKLKKKSLIHANVDTHRLTVILGRSKELYLEPILGNDFFNHLNTAVSFTPDEQKLVDDYIYPFVTVSTEIMASKHLNWEIRNKSTGVSNDTYQRANSWSENDKFVNDLLKQAQMYKDALVTYLIRNKSLFTLFTVECGEDLNSNSMSSQFGFAINRKSRRYAG